MPIFDPPDNPTIKLVFNLLPGMAGGKPVHIGNPFNISVTPGVELDFDAELAHALVKACPSMVYVNPSDAPVEEVVVEEEQPGFGPKKGCKTC